MLTKIALKCGADVPFFIYGGTARVRGIGEEIEPLPDIKGYYAVLVKSGQKKSTKDMYQKLDSMPRQKRYTQSFLDAKGEEKFSFFGNAFSALAGDKNIINLLNSQNPVGVSVSGSGPTHFAIFGSEAAAEKAAENLKNSGYKPFVVPFVSYSVEVID